MYIIYIICYAYNNKESVIVVSNGYSGNYKGDNIRYDKSLDSNLTDNYTIHIHSISRVGSTSDSSISNYPLEDP